MTCQWFGRSVLLVYLFILGLPVGADVQLPPIFGHNMVLQAGKPVPVWGRGAPGESVTVVFGGQKRTIRAAADGTWRVELNAMPSNAQARRLTVGPVSFTNVVVGEVWLCAGQSNMRWPLERSSGAKAAIAASGLPRIRLHDSHGRIYPHRRKYSLETLKETTVENYYATEGWRECSPATVSTFSAVAFYFGRKLHGELDVPIGLIHNAVGGVPMETYIPVEVMKADSELGKLLPEWYRNPHYPQWCRERGAYNLSEWLADPQGPAPHHSFEPGFLFDAGMRPLAPFAVRGFLWYQGESNATVDGSRGPAVAPGVNRRKFSTLIHSWRDAWRDPRLPFYYVQLPGLNRDWELFREMQSGVDLEIPHTGMAVTIDVGHPTNVHPADKQPVGERLALLALRDTYGRMRRVAEGPRYRDYRLEKARVVVEFDHADVGLRTSDGKALRGFETAGEDRVFVPAVATVEGGTVAVSAPDVPAPVAVRYAWADDPDANLANGAGLPAGPFRTDAWPVTAGR
jgi:sialate O-acetylesterase